ncbi:MAG: ROK family transcriptional regulator [Pseudomonadota bacterium]
MAQDQVRDFSGGINQSGVRAFNERLLLSILQRSDGLSSGELARRTGLSPQTTSVILRKMEQDGLLVRGDPVKGKVGKPSQPFTLNPDGAFAVGLKLGRRSADLVVLDLAGRVRSQLRQTYDAPRPGPVMRFLHDGFQDLTSDMSADSRARLGGLGIAAPFELWNWTEVLGADAGDMAAWKETDMVAEVSDFTGLPVQMVNDATAACRAEHIFGIGRAFRDYVYFFVGALIGGGVVLDHAVFEGNQKNAGAFGSLMVPDREGMARPLIDLASIRSLEMRLEAAGEAPRQIWESDNWDHIDAHVTPWIEETADALAAASVAASAVIDFEAVVIDGAMPAAIRARIVDRVTALLPAKDMRGLNRPTIAEGQIGANARGIGAAVGPIITQFLLDRPATMFDHH